MQAQHDELARQQRIRRKQVLMATAVYLTALVPLAYIDSLGMIVLTDDGRIFAVIAALLTNAAFYCLIRFDINLHFREPSMTFAQVLTANAWALILALSVAQAARPLGQLRLRSALSGRT